MCPKPTQPHKCTEYLHLLLCNPFLSARKNGLNFVTFERSLPAGNEVCEGYVFSGVCLSTGRAVVSAPLHAEIYTPGTRGRHPPGTRHPRDQTHPLGSDTPPWDQTLIPWSQTPPQEQTPTPPREQTPPPAVHAGIYGQQRAVRILLECILVWKLVFFSS